ncbi:MAG: TIR domain-containing protein [Pseudomonadota bacterium]
MDGTEKQIVFVSHSRKDIDVASQLSDGLSELGLHPWLDVDELSAGQNWAGAIVRAIKTSVAFILLISETSIDSDHVRREMYLADKYSKPLILINLDNTTLPEDFDYFLSVHQTIDAYTFNEVERWHRTSRLIADTLSLIKKGDTAYPSDISLSEQVDPDAREAAERAAADRRGQATDQPLSDRDPGDSVFLVHGHDEEMLRDVEAYLESRGVRSIVMKDIGDDSMSLLQKFFRIGHDAKFAIVLVSGDDLGGERSKVKRLWVGKWALKRRARQNVILELGYFFGRLGWERVFVLQREDRAAFRDFETPSDLNGVPFFSFSSEGKWKQQISHRLTEHGFKLLSD